MALHVRRRITRSTRLDLNGQCSIDGRAAAWTDKTAKVVRILYTTFNNATADKKAFVQILCHEFPGNQSDVLTDEQASTELSTLSQKEDEDLYAYYRRTETLLTEIAGRDRVSHNGKNAVILNRAEQHILKDTITKFISGLRNLDLRLRMIEYSTEPARSLHETFEKAKAKMLILSTKLKMDAERDLKMGYEAFRSFQASVGNDYRSGPSYSPHHAKINRCSLT